MSSFSCENFQEDLFKITTSSDSIKSASEQILIHPSHFEKIVEIWFLAFNNASLSDQRLALMYVVNDVVKLDRRKSNIFEREFEKYIVLACEISKYHGDFETLKNVYRKLFRIWKERAYFSDSVINDIKTLCDFTEEKSPSQSVENSEILQESLELISKREEIISAFKKLEKCPSFDCESRNQISQMGENFQDPASVLKPFITIIQKPIITQEDSSEFKAKYESTINDLLQFEDFLNTYCTSFRQELEDRIQIGVHLKHMKDTFASQEKAFIALSSHKKADIISLDKLYHSLQSFLEQEKLDETPEI